MFTITATGFTITATQEHRPIRIHALLSTPFRSLPLTTPTPDFGQLVASLANGGGRQCYNLHHYHWRLERILRSSHAERQRTAGRNDGDFLTGDGNRNGAVRR